jgi:hypothetical protein
MYRREHRHQLSLEVFFLPIQIPLALATAKDPEHRHEQQIQAGMRTPRRIRASGIACR